MEQRERLTMMDGEVTDFAQSFEDTGQGILGPRYDDKGAYHVSASRNAVVVHRADLGSVEEVDELIAVLRRARNVATALARKENRGNFKWAETPLRERNA